MRDRGRPLRVIVGITGATGTIYGIRFLERAKEVGIETHVIVSRAARLTMGLETSYDMEYVKSLAHTVYKHQDVSAAIASGSFLVDGMVVVPCSVRSAASIAYSVGDELITRAADVTLKERRRLVLVVRETPLHLGHLRTLTTLAEMGAVILPPMPAFYNRPESLDEMVDHTVVRILDHFGVESPRAKRWYGPEKNVPELD